MKKAIVSFFVVVTIIGVCITTSFATTHTRNIEVDFSKNYTMNKENGMMTLRYNTGGWFTNVRASTDLSISNDAIGKASVYLKALNGKEASSVSLHREGTVINSGKVQVSGQEYAKKTEHGVFRIVNGVSTGYTYKCE